MGALALVAGALVPVMVVTTAPVAQAAVSTTTVATVGARAAAPGVASLCAATGPVGWTVCGVGALALVGGLAYLTRDQWMPWVGLGPGSGDAPNGTPHPQAGVVLSWHATPAVDPVDGITKGVVRMENVSGQSLSAGISWNYSCQAPGGYISSTQGSATTRTVSATSAVTQAINFCPAGSSAVQVGVFPRFDPNTGAQTASGALVLNSLNWYGPSGYTNGEAAGADPAVAQENANRMNFRVERECRDAAGALIATVVTTTARAPLIPSCGSRYPGSESGTTKIWGGFDPNNIKVMPPQVITNDVKTRYPACAGGVCTLEVFRRGVACQEGATGCVDWVRRSILDPADYSCRYGPYTLPIAQCDVLERYYEVNGRALPATGPNVDGDPDTQTPVGLDPGIGTPVRPIVVPNPTATPNPTGTPQPTPTYTLPPFFNPEPNPDAAPGAPRPNPTSNPDGSPNTDPDPYTYPDPNGVPNPNPNPTVNPDGSPRTDPGPGTGPGGTPQPGAAPGPGGNPLDNPANSSCWPNGWGWFNPAEWVLRPLACAFIPRASTQARMSDLAAQLRQKPPYTVAAGAFGVLASLDGQGSECWVQTTALPGIGDGQSITILDTCTPGPIEGALMSYRAVLLAAVWISVLAPLAWWFWREYAPGSKGVA